MEIPLKKFLQFGVMNYQKKNNHLIKQKSFDYISSKKGSLKRSIEKVKEWIK